MDANILHIGVPLSPSLPSYLYPLLSLSHRPPPFLLLTPLVPNADPEYMVTESVWQLQVLPEAQPPLLSQTPQMNLQDDLLAKAAVLILEEFGPCAYTMKHLECAGKIYDKGANYNKKDLLEASLCMMDNADIHLRIS